MPEPALPMRREERCRGCGGAALEDVLALGDMPLANALLTEEDLARPEPRFPLTLAFCPDCSLAQIRETVDPEVLFRHYLYLSSFSETMLQHARHLAERLAAELRLGAESLVFEIASNDGYLLRSFVEHGIPVLGCEPALNVARVAIERGVPTLTEFFGRELAGRLVAEGRRPDLVLGNNVLAHVPDLDGVTEGISILLGDRGHAVLEFPYVGDLLERTEFDTIYHEHLCYFSLHAVSRVFARHGLVLVDVERIAIHGGSLRIHLVPAAGGPTPSRAVTSLEEEEIRRGLTTPEPYRALAGQVSRLKDGLWAELRRRKAAGERIAAYGASAKGSTLLNAFGIGAETLDFVVDRSTLKQGRFTPGSHLRILPPDALLARRPDAVLLLTWNFADEIVRQQRGYLAAGGRFVIPVPAVRSVGAEALR